MAGLIQTNAQLASGDSGGPLVNRSGQVVGIDTAAPEVVDVQHVELSGEPGERGKDVAQVRQLLLRASAQIAR